MLRDWLKDLDRTNALVAAGVSVTVFLVYLSTMAATVTFWDCGEFIAVSHILGIPHPPGTPLFVLVGRLFAMLPFFADASARINFVSVICSTLAALFGYLSGVRIMRPWFASDNSTLSRFMIYAGAAAGALFLALGRTGWGNAVEAEVYGLSMAMFMGAFWLTLIYHETPRSSAADRIMLAVLYIAFLGIGAHQTTLLILPFCALFFILRKESPVWVWFVTAIYLFFELYLIFALSSRPHEVGYYVPVIVAFVLFLFYVFSLEQVPKAALVVGGGFLVAMLPVYQFLFAAARRAMSGMSAPLETANPVASIIGLIGLAGLVLYSIVLLGRYLSRAKSRQPEPLSLLVVALFGIGTGLMAGVLLLGVRGYTAFGVVSILLTLVLALAVRQYVRWLILVALAGVALIAIGQRPFWYGSLAAVGVILLAAKAFRDGSWKTALLIVVAAWLGFSVHLYIPIRSAEHPYINENNPSQNVASFVNFLERKQYGAESMTSRMFTRRGEWENQFGNYRRMGFWGFFNEQYGLNGPRFFVAFVLGLFGLWEAIRIRSQLGLGFAVLVLVCSVGLVLYMNFADGTRQNPVTGQDYIEVRDRDYFWTPAFLLFGLAIGLGITSTIQYIRDSVAKLSLNLRRPVIAASLVLFLLPVYALARNYHESDRSQNRIAFNYAWNLLQSADTNAVFFTYGDNDTFPLWALQEAHRIRKDVRVVNLSLSGMKWYQKQVRDYMEVDLGMSDRQIDAIEPYRTEDGRVFQISDQLVDAVIDNNRAKRPINFSVTVPADSRKHRGESADAHLRLVGMKWRWKETADGRDVATDESMEFLMNPERFRLGGLNDPNLYKDENMLRLSVNYGQSFVVVGDTLRRARRFDDAERLAAYALAAIPYSGDLINFLATVYAEQGKAGPLADLMDRTTEGDRKWLSTMLARIKRKAGAPLEAEQLLTQVLTQNPTYRPAFEELARLYVETNQYPSLKTLLDMWLNSDPSDQDVRRLRDDLVKQMSGAAPTPSAQPK
ncbi:MAG: DUF2723 domain-containing protein [Candidatus Zixiibacteriota bacterium]